MDLTVSLVSQDENRTVLRCAGAIDFSSRDVLADVAGPLIGPGEFVVDLADVSFVDSTGIGALVTLSQSLDDVGGRLIVRDPSRPVQRILEVSGLSDLWSGPTD